MAWTPSRAALAAITAGVVVAGVGAGILFQPTKDRDPPKARGPNVSIAVVAPREPVPEPGGIMDVGDLTDGYMHRDHARQTVVYRLQNDIIEYDPPAPVAPRRAERPPEVAPRPAPAPVIAARRERAPRWPFGFDQPGPDYVAERRERREQMDEQRRYEAARMAERFDEREVYSEPRDDRDREPSPDRDRRERQWYRSDGSRAPGPEARD